MGRGRRETEGDEGEKAMKGRRQSVAVHELMSRLDEMMEKIGKNCYIDIEPLETQSDTHSLTHTKGSLIIRKMNEEFKGRLKKPPLSLCLIDKVDGSFCRLVVA